MVGFIRVIRVNYLLRAMTLVTVLFVMRSENTAISGTIDGPHTTSTQAHAGAGADDDAGATAGTVEAGAAAICGIAEGGPDMR
jgi:diacylglycerol kinase